MNDRRHAETMKTKYPPAFGIDVLADDSVAVADEGRRPGYDVIRVDPNDDRWVEHVLVQSRTRDGP